MTESSAAAGGKGEFMYSKMMFGGAPSRLS